MEWPQCFSKMRVQKTQPRRSIKTLKYGQIFVRVVTLICRKGCRGSDGSFFKRQSDILSGLVPKRSNIGYDVEVFVGLQRYLHHKQRQEIKADLFKNHGIDISTGEISTLARRFLMHLEKLHQIRSCVFREALSKDGGYPLHIDATGESGLGTLFVAFAGWREWVLGGWRLTTECANQILPCLEQTAEQFGAPLGVMRDLGRAMIPATEEFAKQQNKKGKNILIWSCHQHFLKDIGKDLLKDSYSILRSLLREHKIETSLKNLVRDLGNRLGCQAKQAREEIREWAQNGCPKLPSGSEGLAIIRSEVQWTLDYEADNKNLRFPFDRPLLDLYERCRTSRRAIDAYFRDPPQDLQLLRATRRFASIIDPIITNDNFDEVTQVLRKRATLFDKLRAVLRPEETVSKKETQLRRRTEKDREQETADVQITTQKFIRSLRRRRLQKGIGQDLREAIDIILEHMDRYQTTLWGHVIKLPGGKIRVVDRTNILAEGFFNGLKHGERRRSGRKVLNQDLEDLPPAAALTQNLQKADYVTMLCGSLDVLPEAFATIDGNSPNLANWPPIRDEERIETASLSRSDQNFVRKDFLGQAIRQAALSQAPRVEVELMC